MTGRLSEAISRRTGPDRFITFFLLLLDPATGEIEYTNAGHNPGLLLHEDGIDGGARLARPAAGALSRASPTAPRSSRSSPDDLLCLYTDGVTEANNPAGDEFGMPRLKEFLGAQVRKPTTEIEAELGQALEDHAQGEPFADDRTLVMVRRLAP